MSRRAFSLVEVMAAVAIFGVGLAAVFSCLGVVTQQFEHQRHTTFALHLAEARLEELLVRVASDSEIAVGATFGPSWFDLRGFPVGAGCSTATSGLPPQSDSCRYRVTWQAAPGGIAAMRNLTVTVTWNERGASRDLSLTTQRN